MSLGQRRGMVDQGHPSLSVVRQWALPGVSRSSLYYRSKGGLGRGPGSDGGNRPAVPGDPLLRVEADEGLPGPAGYTGKPEAGAAVHGHHGVCGPSTGVPAPANRHHIIGSIPIC